MNVKGQVLDPFYEILINADPKTAISPVIAAIDWQTNPPEIGGGPGRVALLIHNPIGLYDYTFGGTLSYVGKYLYFYEIDTANNNADVSEYTQLTYMSHFENKLTVDKNVLNGFINGLSTNTVPTSSQIDSYKYKLSEPFTGSKGTTVTFRRTVGKTRILCIMGNSYSGGTVLPAVLKGANKDGNLGEIQVKYYSVADAPFTSMVGAGNGPTLPKGSAMYGGNSLYNGAAFRNFATTYKLMHKDGSDFASDWKLFKPDYILDYNYEDLLRDIGYTASDAVKPYDTQNIDSAVLASMNPDYTFDTTDKDDNTTWRDSIFERALDIINSDDWDTLPKEYGIITGSYGDSNQINPVTGLPYIDQKWNPVLGPPTSYKAYYWTQVGVDTLAGYQVTKQLGDFVTPLESMGFVGGLGSTVDEVNAAMLAGGWVAEWTAQYYWTQVGVDTLAGYQVTKQLGDFVTPLESMGFVGGLGSTVDEVNAAMLAGGWVAEWK